MIIDASVAIKLFFREPDTDAAVEMAVAETLAAPDLLIAELANAAWKKQRRGEAAHAHQRISAILQIVSTFVASDMLLQDALALAVALDHPAYDCFYLALAAQRDEQLITADRRFHMAADAAGFADRLVMLADWER